MALQSLPAKPAQGANWIAYGDVLHANMVELVTDFPAVKVDINTLQTTKAPLNSPTFTGTVSGITKAMVGLGNVDNTSDSAKTLAAGQITSGVFPPARLGSGSASASTVLYGDGTWKAAPSGGGGGNVTRYVWDGTGTPTRPSATYVDWLAPTSPATWMQTGDTWTITAGV